MSSNPTNDMQYYREDEDKQQKAEFLMPDRTHEILSAKPDASLDEVLEN